MSWFRYTLRRSSHFIWRTYIPKHLERSGHLPHCWLFAEAGKLLYPPQGKPGTVKIPFSWGRKISLLGLKPSLSKFLTNHDSFPACLIRQRFECHRSPEKTGLCLCPHSLVIKTWGRCLSSFSLFSAEHRLWQSCSGEETNYCSCFSGMCKKQHSCKQGCFFQPCSL